MLINVKMPTIIGILTFMSRINFVLGGVEYEKKVIISRPDFGFVIFCIVIDIGPKFLSALSPLRPVTLRSRSQTQNFYVKILFLSALLSSHMMDIIKFIIFAMMIDQSHPHPNQ